MCYVVNIIQYWGRYDFVPQSTPFVPTLIGEHLVTIAGDSASTSTIEEWDGNVASTACSAYTYNCGLIFFGQKSTKDGALSGAAHYVNGVSIHDISLIMAPFMPGTYFKQPQKTSSLGGTMNAEVYNTFTEGSSYLCIGGGGSGVPNSGTKIHDNYLRYCGWGGPAYTGSQAALNTVVPYVKVYNNTVYYSGQCIENGAPNAEILNNRCEAKDDVTGAAMPYPTVSPQICLNFGSSTYGYWNMVAKGNVCKDYQNGGGVSNSIGVMSNIEIEDNTFINTQGFYLANGLEGAGGGWPGGNMPPTIHGTSYFVGNKFIFDKKFVATGNQGITLVSPREKWVIDHNNLLMPLNSGCSGACIALNFAQGASFPAWQPSTGYPVYANTPSVVQPPMPNGYWYATITGSPNPCTSGSSAPTWPTTVGNTVTDNNCTWTNMGVKPVSVISNLDMSFPFNSTGGWAVQNQGLLPSEAEFSNITNSGNMLSGTEGIYYSVLSWSLTGFPAESWAPTRQIWRSATPFSSSNRASASGGSLQGPDYFRVNDVVTKTSVVGGASLGWQCTRTGWIAKPWAPSTFYPYNSLVEASPDDGYLFTVITAAGCTSDGSQPAWNISAGDTTTDNTCTWQESGASAQFVLRPPN